MPGTMTNGCEGSLTGRENSVGSDVGKPPPEEVHGLERHH